MARLTIFKPEYCEQLIKHMSKGFSYETFGAEVNCGRSTLYLWESEFPEWAEAKKTALEKAQTFFEQRLIAKISGQDIKGVNVKNIDTSCLIFALKTRFHKTYSEKTHQTIDASVKTETIEQYLARTAVDDSLPKDET